MTRGNLFTLDAVIAVLLLIITAAVLIEQIPREQDDFYTDRMATDVINVLAHTKVTDVCVTTTSCTCPNYPKLDAIVCSGLVQNNDASILELVSELILTGAASHDEVEDCIHEIFVTKHVLDEKRFGFSLVYTMPSSPNPLELYNSETYTP